jgi:hypothetical protein
MAMPTGAATSRRRVVYAVADHGHGSALRIERLDSAQLVLGQETGAELHP